jgi:hypothetical protein
MPRLRTVAIDREFVAAKRLDDEIRYDPSVIFQHPFAVGIENTNDTRVDLILPMVIHHQGFGNAFALVIAGTQPSGFTLPQ